ncbi:hypothetical protein [Saccharopolyspora spinosa]|uniref:Uncharacterized protein n=1 Tax=Saccharopolyspora spinosa TaxID=60894 RepID=A0A2N3Y5T9_SACSN|nr:hypothetical protein [Saccharopolyspora spinosa]PKW18243.1 hypothetical protein A8926_6313 [Saccharopolyspora spinosa]
MNAFFNELGRKFAEKWFSLLVLPGLLLVATALVAGMLGHSHALDWNELLRRADAWSSALGRRPPMAQLLVVGAVLLASTIAGLIVRGLTARTQRLWLGVWVDARSSWVSAAGEKLRARRERRWRAADDASAEAVDEATKHRFARRRNRISLATPVRPTFIGDRIAAADTRVHHQYEADVESWWPRLWLILDDTSRAELRAAREAFDTAANQATWAVGYLLIGLFWWPALPIAACVWVNGWLRGRDAAHTYATLIESTVDVFAADLAVRLRMLQEGEEFTRSTGEDLTFLFRKGT